MIAKTAIISEYVIIQKPVFIDDNVFIGPFSFIREHTIIRAGTHIGDHAQLMGHCEIGYDCRLHSNVHISKGSKIGNRVFIGPNFIPCNVEFPLAKKLEYLKPKGCIVEDDVKIGAGVILLPGVRVGHDALIGAGAVVTKDVEPYSVMVGVPAKRVGDTRNLGAYQ